MAGIFAPKHHVWLDAGSSVSKPARKICESALLNVNVYDMLTMDDYKASYIVLLEFTIVFNPDEKHCYRELTVFEYITWFEQNGWFDPFTYCDSLNIFLIR